MIRSSLVQLWKLLAPWKVLIAFVAVDAVGIVAIVWTENSSSLEVAMKYAPRPKTDELSGREGRDNRIVRPIDRPADQAGLPEDAAVIGVVVDGKARAYALRSLRHLQQHVVNDLVGGVPITVAHCDVTGCTHVYASRGDPNPWTSRRPASGIVR